MRARAAAFGRSWRIWVRRVHLWLGLPLGLLFVLIGLTGSALAFYVGIDEALHPEARSDAYAPAPGWSSPVWTARGRPGARRASIRRANGHSR